MMKGPRKQILNAGAASLQRAAALVLRGRDCEKVPLDSDPSAAPNLLGLITELREFPDQRFEAIWSSHMLEHPFPSKVPPLSVRECKRVVKSTVEQRALRHSESAPHNCAFMA